MQKHERVVPPAVDLLPHASLPSRDRWVALVAVDALALVASRLGPDERHVLPAVLVGPDEHDVSRLHGVPRADFDVFLRFQFAFLERLAGLEARAVRIAA